MKLGTKMLFSNTNLTAQKKFAKWQPFLNEVEKIHCKRGKNS